MILLLCLLLATPATAQYVPSPVDSWAEVGTELNRVAMRMQKQNLLIGGTVYGDLAIQDRLEAVDTYTDTISVRVLRGKGASGVTISSPSTTSSSATFTATGGNSVQVSSTILLGNNATETTGGISYLQSAGDLYVSTHTVHMGAWKSYTPTWANLTVGNGTLNHARYTQVGKMVTVMVQFNLGSTSAVGSDPTCSLPVPAAFGVISGISILSDTGTLDYVGALLLASTTTVLIRALLTTGTYLSISSVSSTTPFTWTTGDIIYLQFTYEAQ